MNAVSSSRFSALLRLIMGLIPPWGGREQGASTHRAIVFQRPTMLRRSAAGNIRYALAAAATQRRDARTFRCRPMNRSADLVSRAPA
jgi:hypothetical protein